MDPSRQNQENILESITTCISIPDSMSAKGKVTSIPYRVQYAETDQMGLVYYANYFLYFERIRNELIRDCGTPYRIIESEGIMLPVVETHAEYFLPARYDDLITLTGWFAWLRGSRFQINYEVTLEEDTLVRGLTIHTAISRDGNPRRVPEILVKYFSDNNDKKKD